MATEQQLALTHGSLRKMQADGYDQPVVLKVKSLTPKDETKYMAVLVDGEQEKDAVLSSQLSVHVKAGRLGVGSIIKVTGCTCNMVPNKGWVLMVSEAEVLATPGSGGADAVAAVLVGTPGAKVAAKPEASPTPMHTPSMIKQERSITAGGPTPPSAAPPSVSQRTSGFSCISALHPYNEQWRLRAKLARKMPLRSIKLKGVDTAVFSVELIDEEGSQIQGTFWRNHAERWNSTLVEGKVYVFERFAVKPANKQYSSVRNDYEIAFTDKTEVSEAADQSAGEAMTAAVDLVPIDQLMRYVSRKVAVDVMGVVVAVGSGGTVKRKSDSSELARRDVTLADKSGKSVVLTLWGDNVDASGALEGLENQAVVQCTACRVTDYNGCSLSTLTKSVLTINPSSEQAEELLAWWRVEGAALSLQPVGGESAKASGSGQAGIRQLSTVKEVVSQPIPDLDAKPVYHNMIATVAYINPEQTMYYLANPETGRKVVEQDDRYYSEVDGKYCDKASHRYVLSLKVLDATGDVYLSLFNEQAELVLATSADDLATLKSNSEDAYIACCKEAQWTDWSMSVSTKSREYQGDRKMRHTVVSVKPVCYAQEGQKLLTLIERYA